MSGFGFIESMVLSEQFQAQYNAYLAKHPSAKVQGTSRCVRCGTCCHIRPCALSKEDVPKIAEFLGITITELLTKHLVVDKIGGNYCLLPIRAHQKELAGKFIPWRETYSMATPCAFYDEKAGCKIHGVKPFQGRITECWTEEDIAWPEWTKEELVALGWSGDEDCDDD